MDWTKYIKDKAKESELAKELIDELKKYPKTKNQANTADKFKSMHCLLTPQDKEKSLCLAVFF